MASVQKFTPSSPFVGKVTLNGQKKIVVSFELENSCTTLTSSKVDGTTEYIFLLDRSGSMCRDIDALIEDVKKVIRTLDTDDYVTIIWFSGEGQYRTVVKCAKNSCDDICKILDGLKSTVGCTCFSDPIAELGTIIEETACIADVINVTIFTDGEPVTSWSRTEELRRIFNNLDAIKDKIVAFNTIGYGNYYNRELLKQMSDVTEYGVMTHASKITDYSSIVATNIETIKDLVGKRVRILADYDSTIITQSKTGCKMFERSGVIRLSKQLNAVHIIFDNEDDYDEVAYFVDGVPYVAKAKAKYSMTKLDDIMYLYAYQLMYNNKRADAISVLNFIGNKVLLDDVMSSFTASEVGEFMNNLKGYALKTKSRPKSKIARNSYMPSDDDVSVVDIIEFLVNRHAMYMPNKSYKRIGKKVVDEFDLFTPNDNNVFNYMSNLTLNKDKMNISIQFIRDGKVRLNPIQARQVGLPSEVPAKIFRNHTIIKDGALNMKTIRIAFSEKLDNLTEREQVILDKIRKYQKYESTADEVLPETIPAEWGEYVIDLSKFRLVRGTEDMSISQLYTLEKTMLNIEVQLKVLNHYLKDKDDPRGNITPQSDRDYLSTTQYTAEQYAVLASHGLNKSMTYSAIAPKTQSGTDYYVARQIKTYMKGFSTIPPVEKTIEKWTSGKKLTASESLLMDTIQDYRVKFTNMHDPRIVARMFEDRDRLKNLLNSCRLKVSTAKFIRTALGNPWFDNSTEDTFTFNNGDKYDLVVTYSKVNVEV